MPPVTKSIGTIFRFHTTIQLWVFGLDDPALYNAGDDAIGEMYDDSDFDESVTINTGITIGLNSVKLTVPVGQRHDGTANTGVRLLASADRAILGSPGYPGDCSIEWLELDANSTASQIGGVGNSQTDFVNIRNCILHDVSIPVGTYVVLPRDAANMRYINNVVYNIIRNGGTGATRVFPLDTIFRTVGAWNNTVYNLIHNGTTGTFIVFPMVDKVKITCVNNICLGLSGSATGSKLCFDPISPPLPTNSNNLSSDGTASGTGSVINKTAANNFKILTLGSEDLHLKNAADAIDAGVILGSVPTGVNISMPNGLTFRDGLDRVLNPQGTSTDIGACEFLSADAGDPGLLVMSVTDDMTTINAADVITGWLAGNDTSAESIDADISVQGSGSVVCRVNGITTPSGLMYDTGAGLDLSSKHIYVWGFTMQKVDTRALGGWRVRVSSSVNGLTNYGEWFVGGNDTVIGANQNFQSFIVDTTRAFDNTSGTPPALTTVQSVGVASKFLTSNGRLSFFVDELKHGTGVNIRDGRDADPGLFSAVAADDKAFGRGVMVSAGGVFYVTGQLKFGNDATVGHVFKDSNFVILFEDMKISASHDELVFVSNSQGFGVCEFGLEIGAGSNSVGVGGGLFKSLGPRFLITITDATFNSVKFLGSTITGAGVITLTHAGISFISVTIDDCDTVNLSGNAEFRFCNISNALTSALSLIQNPALDTMKNLNIQNSPIGITVISTLSGGVLDLDNVQFLGNTNDIEVTGTAALTINVRNGGSVPANISTPQGATVTVNNLIKISVTVIDSDSFAVQGASVYVEDTSKNLIMNAVTDGLGVASVDYAFVNNIGINIRVRKSTLPGIRYVPFNTTGILTGTAFSTVAVLSEDSVAALV